MKFSLYLGQKYSDVDFKSIPKDELLHRIGTQLGAVEDTKDWAELYEGVVIVKIVSCEKHPDADKLSLCRIDDGGKNSQVERGDDGLIQVVCGAPNAKADMFAAWLPPGATVPSTKENQPFILEAREIRGQLSNGMLGSAKELAISDNHDGIIEVVAESGQEPNPGQPIAEFYNLDDFVVDCENKMFTHRPDCFGNLGIAREIAGITAQKFKSPDWYLNPLEFESKSSLSVEVKNEAPELVPRFMAVVMENITIKPSPIWLQALLTRVGIKPINNVVDASNYVMHLTGQPTHAFDYDKLQKYSQSPSLFPRMSQKGEKLKLLGGKEIELSGEEIVISTDKQAVGLAGVMGGADTEVDENTKAIVIECATFDMYSIRRTSMKHGLFTDAVTRYNKGQSPLQNNAALAYLMKNMSELAGAQQASHVYDIQSGSEPKTPVDVSISFINERLGTDLNQDEIKKLLENVEISADIQGENLQVFPPFWRMDIEIPEDIVEEVGRLRGYDKLPVELPPRSSKPSAKNQLRDYKMKLRFVLKELGANEVLTYSFVHGKLLKNTGIDADKWCYHLRNAISPDLQYYRPSLIPSLLAKVHSNIKAGAGSEDNQFAIFEVGKAHVKGHEEEGLPTQMERLGFVVAADEKTAKAQQTGAAYYLAKKYLDKLTNSRAVYKPLEDNEYPITSPYARGRSAVVEVNGQILGVLGEFKQDVKTSLKLPEFTAGFELDIELLKNVLSTPKYIPLPKFPESQQDFTLAVDKPVLYAETFTNLKNKIAASCSEKGYMFNIEPIDIFEPEGSQSINYTFRIAIWHPDKTLLTEEVNSLIAEL